jgi:hypothetical protein
MKKIIQLGFVLGILMASTMVSTQGAVSHQTKPTSTSGDAVWAADLNSDGLAETRGWLTYTLEKGIFGHTITIRGTWGYNDSSYVEGSFSIKNIAIVKFLGVYKGLYYGSITGGWIGVRFIGVFYNDWEVGYWQTIMPDTVKVQVVHIPFG